MFTGIVTHIGTLARMERSGDGARLRVDCAGMAASGLRLGESISVSGVCLTVESEDATGFSATASPETLRKTSLGSAAAGDRVNLERALAASDRLGGHFVQGHVDGVGRIESIRPEGVSRNIRISAPEALRLHLVDRGSVAVDGVSLTVTSIHDSGFGVTLIPATLQGTVLGTWEPGRPVNLEADILSKYVARLLEARTPGADIAGWLAGKA